MKEVVLIWLAAYYTSAHGYVALEGMEGGACINAKLQENFEINKFQGVWYEAQSAPNMFQLTKKCTRMEYIWNGNVVKATTTGLGEEDQPTKQSSDMSKSATNAARFIINPPESPEMEIPFDILSTDYKNYACVYSCLKYENFKAEFTWALTRDKTKINGAGAICRTVFERNRIDVSKLAETYHGALCIANPKTSNDSKPAYKGIYGGNTKTNSKGKKKKYNWTPNNSWKPYEPRSKQNNNNEVSYNSRKPYTGLRSIKPASATNVQSITTKKAPSKPIQRVEVKRLNKGYNPYLGYRNKKEDKYKQVITKVLSTSQKKSPFKPIPNVVNKGYNPYIKTIKENREYKPYTGIYKSRTVRNRPKEDTAEGANNTKNDTENDTEKNKDQPYVGYRSSKRVDTNKSDKPKDTANNFSIYRELKNSNEDTLIPKENKVYRSNWGTTYGVRRQNAWGSSMKQNDEPIQAQKSRPIQAQKRSWNYIMPKHKNQERNIVIQPRRKWSTIESIKVKVADCKDSDKSCGYWATSGECKKNAAWMNKNCAKSCGSCYKSKISSGRSSATSLGAPSCSDKNPECQGWAAMGECKKNSMWMNVNCELACGQC